MEKYYEYIEQEKEFVTKNYPHLSEDDKEKALYIRVSVRLFFDLENANEKIKKYENK